MCSRFSLFCFFICRPIASALIAGRCLYCNRQTEVLLPTLTAYSMYRMCKTAATFYCSLVVKFEGACVAATHSKLRQTLSLAI